MKSQRNLLRSTGAAEVGVEPERLDLGRWRVAARKPAGERGWDRLILRHPRIRHTCERALPALRENQRQQEGRYYVRGMGSVRCRVAARQCQLRRPDTDARTPRRRLLPRR